MFISHKISLFITIYHQKLKKQKIRAEVGKDKWETRCKNGEFVSKGKGWFSFLSLKYYFISLFIAIFLQSSAKIINIKKNHLFHKIHAEIYNKQTQDHTQDPHIIFYSAKRPLQSSVHFILKNSTKSTASLCHKPYMFSFLYNFYSLEFYSIEFYKP